MIYNFASARDASTISSDLYSINREIKACKLVASLPGPRFVNSANAYSMEEAHQKISAD